MSRAQIRVDVNEKMTIDRTTYRVAEHPALPGIPYVQRGARGFVIQLIAPNGDRMALKYFKLKYRVPALVNVAEALRQYADLPGLRAARRTVFTQSTHPDLLARYPALEYGVLMPWLPGVTWYDLVTTKAPISPRESLKMAQATSEILANFEEHHLAHCDIAGANVMVERRAAQIELVDIEEMYGPNLPQPVEMPAGQDGYQHRTSRQSGQWNAAGDRFGAAVLLAEMLGWADARVRQNSADEHYFSAAEMQDVDSPRYRLLVEVLRDEYAPEVAEPFEQAWRSARLDDCPPLKLWRDTLDAISVDDKSQDTVLTSPVVSGRRAIDGIPVVVQPDKASPLRFQLNGTRLCRNCGAQNAISESFCKRCGFYIGTGVRRPPPPVKPPAPGVVKALSPVQPPTSGTAPQPVVLQHDGDDIIAARRIGTLPGGQVQRVVTPPKPQNPQEPANFGAVIVAAVIVAAAILVLLLALRGG
jgi:hypothetical protein